jgi:hypothetical protein
MTMSEPKGLDRQKMVDEWSKKVGRTLRRLKQV